MKEWKRSTLCADLTLWSLQIAADRRPSSNADPYLVTGKIMATIMEDVEVPEIAPLNKDN